VSRIDSRAIHGSARSAGLLLVVFSEATEHGDGSMTARAWRASEAMPRAD
jgi:hypothetical protein